MKGGPKIAFVLSLACVLPFGPAASEEGAASAGPVGTPPVSGPLQMAPPVAQPRAAPSLVGTWRAQLQTPLGPAQGETILMPNGTFTKLTQCGQFMTREWGRYTVGNGYVHFDYEGHLPTHYQGKQLHYPNSETVFFRFLDPNRMLCEDRILKTRWEAYRVR